MGTGVRAGPRRGVVDGVARVEHQIGVVLQLKVSGPTGRTGVEEEVGDHIFVCSAIAESDQIHANSRSSNAATGCTSQPETCTPGVQDAGCLGR